jgi:hypothetical protein
MAWPAAAKLMPSETLTGCKIPPNTKAPLPMTRLQSAKKYKMGGMGRNSKRGISAEYAGSQLILLRRSNSVAILKEQGHA